MGLRIGSFLGNVAKGIIRATPVGSVINAVAPSILAPTSLVPTTAFSSGSGPGRPGSAVVPVPGFGGMVSRALPFGDTGYTTRSCLTKDGRARRIKANGQCWKRPTMNVLNVNAAKRSITRLKGLRRILHSIEAGMPKVHVRPKGKRCGCK